MKKYALLICLFVFSSRAVAQDPAAGIPPYTSIQSNGFDAVNRQDLNVMIAIPIVSSPGRGMNLTFSLVQNSLLWKLSGSSWVSVTDRNGFATWGWQLTNVTGSTKFVKRTYQCFNWDLEKNVTYNRYDGYAFVEPNGTKHPFNISISTLPAGCGGPDPNPRTGYATDASGLYLDATSPDYPTVVTTSGTRIDSSGTMTDTNGNYISAVVVSSSETDWKDSAGRTALKIIKGSGYNDCQTLDESGNYQTTHVVLGSLNIQTAFACAGKTEYTGTASLPTQISLPNGQSYLIQYEVTPGGGGTYRTGRISSVTLPSGAVYSYNYFNGPNDGINCNDGTVINLTAGAATWTYARTQSQTDPTIWTTLITAPQLPYDTVGNQTQYTFTNGRETSVQIYQGTMGGTPLRTINTTWSTQGTPASKTVILEDGQTQAKTETDIDSYGVASEVREYDWGTGAPGSLVRTTHLNYLLGTSYTNINIRNRPAQMLIYEGSSATGTLRARTDITYDTPSKLNSPCITGALQHNDTSYGCSYTARGLPTSITTYASAAQGTGAVTYNSTYDSLGNLRIADVNGTQQEQLSYSTATQYAFPDSETDGPSGSSQLARSAAYNAYIGTVSTTTDENGKQIVYNYTDPLTRLTGIHLPNGTTITQQFDDTNRVVTTNMPVQGTNVLKRSIYYDTVGRVTKVVLADSSFTSFSISEAQYDALDRIYRQSNPHNSTAQWTEARFDALGRPTMVIPPDGSASANRTSYSYSLSTVTITDQTGKSRKLTKDALGRTTQVTEPDPASGTLNVSTSYSFNGIDKLLGLSQGSQTRTFSYDDLGRVLSVQVPETNQAATSYQYNQFGLVTQRTDPRGVITTNTYDTLNRLSGISYSIPQGSGVASMPNTVCTAYGGVAANTCFTYGTSSAQNNNGRVTQVMDGSGNEQYTYDLSMPWVTSLTKNIGGTSYLVQYSYNLAGQLTETIYPSGRKVDQGYDSVGRLSSVFDNTTGTPTNYASGYAYNPAGQVTAFNYGNGVAASLGYSADRLQLTSLSYVKGATTLFSLSYGYAQNGGNNAQITSITDNVDNGRSVTYTYDALYRLSTAVTTGSTNYPHWGLSETYDRYGNRTAQTVTAGSGPSNSVTVDPATNRITGAPYAYDLNGNMTNDGLNSSMVYDGESRLVSLNNSAASYTYDGKSLRVKKVSGSTTTVYVFSGSNVLAEYDNGAAPTSPTREYIYSGGALVAKIEGSATKYYHQDYLSNRIITDVSGTAAEQHGHFPFGEDWYSGADKWKFTTYERDSESVNDYAVFRYYVSRLGRFASPDLLHGSIADPQSLNRYAYASNDPCNVVDPLGLEKCHLKVNVNNRAGLSVKQLSEVFKQISAILSEETDRNGNSVGIYLGFDQQDANFTLDILNVSDPLSNNLGNTTCIPLVGCIGTPKVYPNRVYNKVFAGGGSADLRLGSVAAHELVHRIADILHPSEQETGGPNLMNEGSLMGASMFGFPPGGNNPYVKLTKDQIGKLFEVCKKKSQGSGGGQGLGGTLGWVMVLVRVWDNTTEGWAQGIALLPSGLLEPSAPRPRRTN